GADRPRQSPGPVDRAPRFRRAAMPSAFMDDLSLAAEQARKAVAVAEQHGYREWRGLGGIIAAWAAAVAQPDTRSLADVTTQIGEYTRMGLRGQLAPLLCLAAGAYIEAGAKQDGIGLLDRAAAHARESGELWYE